MPLDPEDRRHLRILFVVVAGFVAGLALLFYLIATDV
jgi:phage shock protein PspC (stress-responsive transcriptional regulator)